MVAGRRMVLVTLMVLAAVAASCGGSDDATEESSGTGGAAGEAARVRTVAAQPAQSDREVIYTADLVVRASAVDRAAERAVEATREAGGFVFAQDTDLEGDQEALLTLKVPPASFDAVLTSLADLGRVLRRQITAQDVTDEVVDLDGRLKTAQASADRLRALLAEARTAMDLVAVEGELAKRESEIESLQGRLRVMTAQVALATINLRLTERGDVEVSKDLPGFVRALRAGWVALANVALAALAVIGFSVPFLPFVALAWWLTRRVRRRAPRPRPPAPPSGPGSPPAPTPAEGPAADAPERAPSHAT
ncbi:MAG: DUF4349 domain-containing protein [Acidimicrobiales bacterium]